jgi:hypothetical protein
MACLKTCASALSFPATLKSNFPVSRARSYRIIFMKVPDRGLVKISAILIKS